MLLLLRPAFGSSEPPVPTVTPDRGWYVYNKNDPKPRRKKKGKFLTVDEIAENKRIQKMEDEEIILMWLKKDFDNEH